MSSSRLGKWAIEKFSSTSNKTQNEGKIRQKRGWFDGVGKGAKEVFGIMNNDDAAHYDNEIKKLRKNEDYLKKSIKNQTLIQEMTANVIRSNEEKLLGQMVYFNKTISQMAEKDSIGKTHIYNTLALQAVTVFSTYH